MALADRIPRKYRTGWWRPLFVLAVILFFIDEFLVVLLLTFLVFGAMGVVVVLVLAWLVLYRTDWGERRRDSVKQNLREP